MGERASLRAFVWAFRRATMHNCPYCHLPMRLHFAWCYESGIQGEMPKEALRPGAIIREQGEIKVDRIYADIAARLKITWTRK
jgi:hypothetical protein